MPRFRVRICFVAYFISTLAVEPRVAISDVRSKPEAVKQMTEERKLPHSDGRVFSNLDDYLAHLKKLSTQDVPYYTETRPGYFVLVTRRKQNNTVKEYSRQELMSKFGFKK